MAASSRGGGTGTSDRGGVRTTMTPAFGTTGTGSQGTMPGPFNAPRAGGANGLPTKIYDSLGGPSATPKASSRDSLGTIKTNPKDRGR